MSFKSPLRSVQGWRARMDQMYGRNSTPWYLSLAGVTPLIAYDAKNAASLAASYTNLITPGTYDAYLGVAPAWAAGTGWTGDGLSTYLKTGFTPTGGSFTMAVRFSGVTQGGGSTIYCVAGCKGPGGSRFAIFPSALPLPSASTVSYYYGSSQDQRTPQLSAGVLAMDGVTQLGYRNGLVDGVAFGHTWTNPAVELYLLCYNANGSIVNYFASSLQLFWLCAGGLTATQHLALASAMLAA